MTKTTVMCMVLAVLVCFAAEETAKLVTAQIGQKVQVDVLGLHGPGIVVGSGVATTGTIIASNPLLRQITVELDASVGGANVVTVAPERVRALQ